MSHIYVKQNGAWAGSNAEAIYRKENGQWVTRDWAKLNEKKYLYEFIPLPEQPIRYVSFGDSIAVGHRIDGNWEKDYGWDAQYGVDGRTETTLVPGCYTDIVRQELESIYGKDRVAVTSFARSGDKVSDLMEKLTHETVVKALQKADLVTICIGANDVLHYALTNLEDYMLSGDMSTIESLVASSLAVLDDDNAAASYMSLFNRLAEINPDAKYVFTTIYNPYKYLYIKEGSSGFFEPLWASMPHLIIDVDKLIEDQFLGGANLEIYNVLENRWVSIELDFDVTDAIQEGILLTPPFQLLFDRVNGLSAWSEKYVNSLNEVLRKKIAAYQKINPNFYLAETKAAFDLFPDKTGSTADVDYSDLVNVEFTRTYDIAQMDWGALWRDSYGSDSARYWRDLAMKHLHLKNAFPSLAVEDYINFDIVGFASDLVQQIVTKVIEPNVDPHPEHYGHQVLKRSFTNVLGLVKYEPNGGSYVPGNVVLAGRKLEQPKTVKLGSAFEGWCTDVQLQQQLNPERTDFADHRDSFTLADLVDGNSVKPQTPKVTTLYARWSRQHEEE